MLARSWLLVIVAFVGCIQSGSVHCGDGQICPPGTTCMELTNPAQEVCATPAQLSACAGLAALAECTLSGAMIARCYDGVCEPAGCGNGRVDPDEVCDDGNATVGDGCSDACLSNETCGNGIVDPLAIDTSGIARPNEQCDDSNTLSHDGCAADCKLELPQWDQIITGPPSPRAGATAVYDAARHRVVLFGGVLRSGTINSGPALADTIEWDGAAWINVTTAIQPLARVQHAMTYDAKHRRVVVFGGVSTLSNNGGVSQGSTLGDMWQYDGSEWVEVHPAHSPSPRYGGAFAYDSKRGVTVLFGGTDVSGTLLGETWEYDGVDWTLRTDLATSPVARSLAVAAYDPKRSVIVMTGGMQSDTWEYDGMQWRDVTPANSANQLELYTSYTMAYDPASKHVIAYGESPMTNVLSTSTYSWDGTTWTKSVTAGPSGRGDPTLVGDPLHGNVILFGGWQLTPCAPFNCFLSLADTYAWNGSSWSTALTFAGPPTARYDMASAFDSSRGRLVIFGGNLNSGAFATDTWEFDGGRWYQGPPSPSPGTRMSPTMTYDAATAQSVLFGGFNTTSSTPFADTWLWNGTAWTSPTLATNPPARFQAAMAYDPVRRRVVMFGGVGLGSAYLPDTWEWDGQAWSNVTPATGGPAARGGARAAWDPIRQRVVMTSGRNLAAPFRETWEWDGTAWTQVGFDTDQQPTARIGLGLAWNGPRERMTVFGGTEGNSYNDLWEWDGTDWTTLFPTASPPGRDLMAITQTPAGDGILFFGGSGPTGGVSGQLGDMWRMRFLSGESSEQCTADVDNDGDGLAGCADPDCWARCTPLCPPGATCDPTWPHCGDGICSGGVEDCRLCPSDCGTCLPVCGDTFCDAGETPQSCPGDCQ